MPLPVDAKVGDTLRLYDGMKETATPYVLTGGDLTAGQATVKVGGDLTDGDHFLTAELENTWGIRSSKSQASQISIETGAPGITTLHLLSDPSTDTGVSSVDGITSNTHPTFRVMLPMSSTHSGDIINLFTDKQPLGVTTPKGPNGWLVGSLTVDDKNLSVGYVDVAVSEAFSEGSQGVRVQLESRTGVEGALSTDVSQVKIDSTPPPALSSLSLTSPNTKDLKPEFSVDLPATGVFAGDVVELELFGKVVGEHRVTAADLGTGTVQVRPTSPLQAGVPYHFAAYLKDIAGNKGAEILAPAVTIPISTTPRVQSIKLVDDTGVDHTDGLTQKVNPRVQVYIEGSSNPGDIVELFVDGQNVGSKVLTQTDIQDGYVTMNMTVQAEGKHQVNAKIKDAVTQVESGSMDHPLSIEIDTTIGKVSNVHLGVGSDTGKKGDGITYVNPPLLSMDLPADKSIRSGDYIVVEHDGNVLAKVVVTDELLGKGSLDVVLNTILPEGSNKFEIHAEDRAGNKGVESQLEVKIDSARPQALQPHLDSRDDTGTSDGDGYTKVDQPRMYVDTSGFKAGQTVHIFDNGVELKTAGWPHRVTGQDVIDGKVMFQAATAMAEGMHRVETKVESVSGLYSDFSVPLDLNIDKTAPGAGHILTQFPGGKTAEQFPTISLGTQGTGLVAGDTAVLIANGVEVGRVGVTAQDLLQGHVDVQVNKALASSQQQITGYFVDKAGNVGANATPSLDVMVDTGNAELTGIQLMSDTGVVGDLVTKETLPSFKVYLGGAATAGEEVELLDSTRHLQTVQLSPQDITRGYVVVTVPVNMTEGEHEIRLLSGPQGQHVASAVKPLKIEIDTTVVAPRKIELSKDTDTGVSPHDGETNSHSLRLKVSIDSNAEVGDTIFVKEGASEVASHILSKEDINLGHVLINLGKQGTYDPTSEGQHSFTAYAKDIAGNISPETLEAKVHVDRTIGDVTSLSLHAGSDTGLDKGDKITNKARPTVDVGVPATGVSVGDTLVLEVDGVRAVVHPISLGEIGGKVSIQLPTDLLQGRHMISAHLVDLAGNSGKSKMETIIEDRLAPTDIAGLRLLATDDTGVSSGDGYTKVGRPTFEVDLGSSNLGEGDQVILYEGGSKIATQTLTPGDLQRGLINIPISKDLTKDVSERIEVKLMDKAGNILDSSQTATVFVDQTPPMAPSVVVLDPSFDTGIKGDHLTSETSPSVSVFLGSNMHVGDIIEIKDKVSGQVLVSRALTAQDLNVQNAKDLYDKSALKGTADGVSQVGGVATIALPTMTDGTRELTATVKDKAGNEASSAHAMPLSIDTSVRKAPDSITLNPKSDTGIPSDLLTRDQKPIFDIGISSTGAKVGDTLELLIDGHLITKHLLTQEDIRRGSVSVDVGSHSLANGQHQASTRISSASGMESPIGANKCDFEIDTSAAPTPRSITLDALSDTGLKGDSTSKDRQPYMKVNISATGTTSGDYLHIYIDGKEQLGVGFPHVITPREAISGEVSVKLPPLADGKHAISTKVGNVVGTLSVREVSTEIVVDTQPPDRPTISPENPGNQPVARPTIKVQLPLGTEAQDILDMRIGTEKIHHIITQKDVDEGFFRVQPSHSLPNGNFTVMGHLTDKAGNVGATASFPGLVIAIPLGQTDFLALAKQSDTGIVGDGMTSDTRPTIEVGTSHLVAGSTVHLYAMDVVNGVPSKSSMHEVGTMVVSAGDVAAGSINLPLTQDMADGSYALVSKVQDPRPSWGRQSPPYYMSVDTVAGSITGIHLYSGDDLGSSHTDGKTSLPKPRVQLGISKEVQAGDNVDLYEGTTKIGTAVVSNSDVSAGKINVRPDTPFTDGKHTVTAKVRDAAGNVGASSPQRDVFIDHTAPLRGGAVSLTDATNTGSKTDAITADVRPAFQVPLAGTNLVAGDHVLLYVDGKVMGDVALSTQDIQQGRLEIPLSQDLSEGAHTATFVGEDMFGNFSIESPPYGFEIAINSLNPPQGLRLVATDDTGVSDHDLYTKTLNPAFQVPLAGYTAIDILGGELVLREGGQTIGTAKITQTDITNGYIVVPSTGLGNAGTFSVTASITDVSGIPGHASLPVTVVVDTTAPLKPRVGLVEDKISDTGISHSDGRTNNPRPDFKVSFGTEVQVGDIVRLYDKGGNLLVEHAVEGNDAHNGYATISPTSLLGEGIESITAKIEDKAGNVSMASDGERVVIDRTPPSAALMLEVAGGDTETSSQTPSVKVGLPGDVEEGDEVFIYAHTGDQQPIGHAIITKDAINKGNIEFPISTILADNFYNMNVAFKDRAGNLGLQMGQGTPLRVNTNVADPTYIQLDAGSDSGKVGDHLTNVVRPTLKVGLGGGVEEGDFVIIDAPGLQVPLRSKVSIHDLQQGYALVTFPADLNEGKIDLSASVLHNHHIRPALKPPFTLELDTTIAVPTSVGLVASSDTGPSSSDKETYLASPEFKVDLPTTGVRVGDTVELMDGSRVIGQHQLTDGDIKAGEVKVSTNVALLDGAHQIGARITDEAGNKSTVSARETVTVDSQIRGKTGAIHLMDKDNTGSKKDTITSKARYDLEVGLDEARQGLKEGDVLHVYDGGLEVGKRTIDKAMLNTGKATVSVGTSREGSHDYTTKVESKAGIFGEQSDPYRVIVDQTAPPQGVTPDLDASTDTGQNNRDNVTSNRRPLLNVNLAGVSGIKAGWGLDLYMDGRLLSQVEIKQGDIGGQNLQIPIMNPLTEGVHTFTTKFSDLAGNISSSSVPLSVTIDTQASAPHSLSLAQSSDTGVVGDRETSNPLLSVKVDLDTTRLSAGDQVVLYENGVEIGRSHGLTHQEIQQHFINVPVANALSEGRHKITAKVDDIAGNISPSSPELEVRIDYTPGRFGQAVLVDDTGLDIHDGLTKTASPRIRIPLLKDFEVGDKFTLDITGVSNPLEHVITAGEISSGLAEIKLPTLHGEGEKVVHIQTVDRSGNVNPNRGTLVFKLDTIAPQAPQSISLPSSYDTGVSSSDGVTSNNQPQFSVDVRNLGNLGEFRAYLTVDGKVVNTYDLTQGDIVGGMLHLTPGSPLLDGEHDVSVFIEDKAGNKGSSAVPFHIKVDTQAPMGVSEVHLTSATDTGRDHTDSITKQDQFTFQTSTFGLEAGTTVHMTVDGQTIGRPWDINMPDIMAGHKDMPLPHDLSEGTHRFGFTVLDKAGNASSTYYKEVVIDKHITDLHLVSSSVSVPGGHVLGMTEPGADIQADISQGGKLLGTIVGRADSLGRFVLDLGQLKTQPGVGSNLNILVKGTDVAGNSHQIRTSVYTKVASVGHYTPGHPLSNDLGVSQKVDISPGGGQQGTSGFDNLGVSLLSSSDTFSGESQEILGEHSRRLNGMDLWTGRGTSLDFSAPSRLGYDDFFSFSVPVLSASSTPSEDQLYWSVETETVSLEMPMLGVLPGGDVIWSEYMPDWLGALDEREDIGDLSRLRSEERMAALLRSISEQTEVDLASLPFEGGEDKEERGVLKGVVSSGVGVQRALFVEEVKKGEGEDRDIKGKDIKEEEEEREEKEGEEVMREEAREATEEKGFEIPPRVELGEDREYLLRRVSTEEGIDEDTAEES